MAERPHDDDPTRRDDGSPGGARLDVTAAGEVVQVAVQTFVVVAREVLDVVERLAADPERVVAVLRAATTALGEVRAGLDAIARQSGTAKPPRSSAGIERIDVE